MPGDDDFERRLSTVLYADVVGYTRLTEADEAGTHRALRHAIELVSKLVASHDGAVAHYAGDAVLAEFTSVLNGLNCAVEIQRAMTERSAPNAPHIRFRIGVNVGDIISDKGEIYGDTVNTAVRLQGVAEAGGICISEAVRNAIGRRLPIAYEFVGEEQLKNLSIPVRAYRALLDTEQIAQPVLEPGAKPSVAVMPFENLGGMEEGEVDGLTEDVIRELSRFRGLEVISHTSTLVYKQRPTKVQQLADELGVEYVLEGHVRHSNACTRIDVRLVSALTGRHLWSELYELGVDRSLQAQDALICRIVATIAGRVHVAGAAAAQRRPSEQLHAFEHVLRGQGFVGKGAENNALARTHYQRALALEPRNARALAGTTLSLIDDWWNGWAAVPEETLSNAFSAAKQAYSADRTDSKVHWVLGLVHILRGELRQAARLVERAHELNPGDADGFAAGALLGICHGDGVEAQRALSTAFSLNPFSSAWYGWLQGLVHHLTDELADARLVLLETLQQNPELNAARACLVTVYVELGDLDAARDATDELMRRNSEITPRALIERIPFSTEHRQRLLSALKRVNVATE